MLSALAGTEPLPRIPHPLRGIGGLRRLKPPSGKPPSKPATQPPKLPKPNSQAILHANSLLNYSGHVAASLGQARSQTGYDVWSSLDAHGTTANAAHRDMGFLHRDAVAIDFDIGCSPKLGRKRAASHELQALQADSGTHEPRSSGLCELDLHHNLESGCHPVAERKKWSILQWP